MKSVMILLGASALVSAQSLPEGFPQCGTVCIPNMLGQASNFNCGGTDWRCLCSNKDFVYGVRDCSDQVCSQDDANTVKTWGKNQCASVGIDIEGIGGSVTGSVPSATATVTATGKQPESSASGSNAGSASQGGATPVTTSDVLTTVTSGGSTITSTLGQTTIFSSSSGGANPSQTQSGSGSAATSSVETVVTSGGSTFTTSTQAGETSTDAQAPPTSSSNNPAAMKTMAPAAAVFAAAGFGLFML